MAGYSGGSCALSNSIFQTRHRHGHCPLELSTAITHWRLHKSVPTNFTLQGKDLPAFPQRFRQLTVVWGEVYEAVPLPRVYPQLCIAERYIFFSDIAVHKLLSFPSVTPVTHWSNKLYLDGIPSFCLWSVPSREQEICLFIWTMGQMLTRAFWERQSTLKGRGFRLFPPSKYLEECSRVRTLGKASNRDAQCHLLGACMTSPARLQQLFYSNRRLLSGATQWR